MKRIFSSLDVNKKLALLMGFIAFFAIFAGNPYKGNKVTLDAKELAVLVEQKVDHVTVEELADWIIKGKTDFRLLDIRSDKEFAEYHINGAENILITKLIDADLKRNEKLILYSEGGIHSAQAWMLLKAEGYNGVYILFGGLEEWKDKVLFPRMPSDSTLASIASFNKMKEISKYFGGAPQSDKKSESVNAKIIMPKIEMPQTGPANFPVGKKKKEGC